jgi:hypothetical protein
MTTSTTTTGPRTRRSPDGGFASVGAVHQTAGSLPVYICNACGREVVWAESKRTGRKYLANVSRGYHDQRFYIGARVHDAESCQRRQDEDRRIEASILREIRVKSGLCIDCGDAGTGNMVEETMRCADCFLDRRAEAVATTAFLADHPDWDGTLEEAVEAAR